MRLTTFLLLILAAFGAAPHGYAQEASGDEAAPERSAAESEEPEEPEEAESADGGDDPDEDDEPSIDLDDPDFADLDLQTYDEDDDDFVPTEEVPADEAIPFPSDI